MDAYDFAEPADILSRLDKALWEGLAAAKWTERRDALRSLRQLASAPRLAPGDYADVVRELRKVRVCPQSQPGKFWPRAATGPNALQSSLGAWMPYSPL